MERGRTTQTYKKVLNWIDSAHSTKEIVAAEDAALKALNNITIDPERLIIKVGIVG